MAKITLYEPQGPYKCTIDSDVMGVSIEEAFMGIGFVTEDEELLGVSMRDSGYELSYRALNKKAVKIELKDGDVYLDGRRVRDEQQTA